MGRAFEYRRARKEKRWSSMSKLFTKWGREIAMAVKAGGADQSTNTRLRNAVLNAKAVNMPKDRVDGAIKRASSKDEANYVEVVYEGYAPHGVAVLVECATDNVNRSVANIRVIFSKAGGAMGASGSVAYLFERKSVFKFASAQGLNIEDLELDLIDFGLEKIEEEDGEIIIYTAMTDFNTMQKALEDKGIEITSAELQQIPKLAVELGEEQAAECFAMIEKLEEDDDVQNVFHNIA